MFILINHTICIVLLCNNNNTVLLKLSDSRKELIVSSAIWACAVGALMAGFLNKVLGRKVIEYATNIIYLSKFQNHSHLICAHS